MDSDPLLSCINGYLASRPRTTGAGAPMDVASLSPEAAALCVDWEGLQLARCIGRGSFGRVFEATWRQTSVAVKVLFSGGEPGVRLWL